MPKLVGSEKDDAPRRPCAGHDKAVGLLLAAAFCCLWVITGCAGVVLHSDVATPQFSLSDSTINFGSVALNTTSTKTFTLTSTGTRGLIIKSVTLAGAGFSSSGISFPATLGAGQTITIQVAFKPTVAGLSTGTVTIFTDSASNSTTKISLSGTAASQQTPQLTVSANSLDFGPVNLNATSAQTLMLTSSGNAALTVNSVTVAGASFAVSGATFPVTLNPGQSLALQLSFDPTVIGAAVGTVSISTDSASEGTSTVNLTGTGIGSELTVSAAILDFGSVNLNTTSIKSLIITSSGNTAVTLNSVMVTGGRFAISGATFPTTLSPGQSLSLKVSFDPVATGTLTGTIMVSSNSASGGTSTVSLTGIGTAAQLTLSSATLDFGNVNVNTTSTKTLTLTSSGNAALTVNSVTTVGAGFAVSGASFPATLNPGQTLTLRVSFDPTTAADAAGVISISSNASSGATTTVHLAGTGATSELSVSQATLEFGNVDLNTTSAKSLTLTSAGNAPVTIQSVTLSGPGFAISGATFPTTLNSGQSMALQVSFDPTIAGASTGTLTVSSNATDVNSGKVKLSGNGVAAQLKVSASTLDFGNVNLNTTSTQTLTLASSGNVALTVNSVTLAGAAFSISGATFPATLNPGQSIALLVSFDPTVRGTVSGTVTICTNSKVNANSAVALTGTGMAAQLTLSASSIDFGNTNLNSSSAKTLTLTSSGNAAVTVNSVNLSGGAFAISGAAFPMTLNPGQSLALQVSFNPTVTGVVTGTATISTSPWAGSTSTVALTGTGVAPELTMSAASLDFGNIALNATSTKTLTLRSSGSASLTINSVTLSGGAFAVSGATFPATLNPGQSMSLQVSFDPTVIGAVTGAVTFSSNSSSGSMSTIILSGTGTTAQLTLSSSALDFGSVNLNTTSTKTLTLTSSGNDAVTINSVSRTGAPFAVSGATFPTTLNPGQSLTLTVSFDPTVTGAATGTITVSSNDSSGGTSTVTLSGAGVAAQLTLGSSTLDFGNINLNTTSTKTLTLTSSGNAALTLNSVTLVGAAFAVSGATFPTTLNPGQSLTLQVSFDPMVTGVTSGTITILSNSARGGAAMVSLSGIGTSAQLTVSGSTLAFGNVVRNSTSTKTLTLTSTGTAAVTVNSAMLTGSGFSMTGATFPTTLNPGQTLTLQVTFNPTTAGAASGSITFASNSSSGGTATVSLSGTGTSPQLSISTSTLAFGNVALSSTSTRTLTLTSSGSAPVTVGSAILTGAGFSMTGATSPTTLNPGQTLTLQVTFSPMTAGAASGTITISSNSSTGGTATIPLSGTGTTNPVLTLSSTMLSFGDDPIGTPITLLVTLSSTGTSPVTVSAAALTGSGFTFSGATFPVTLNPTIAITVQVQFKPTTTGTAAGTLTFTSDSTTGSTTLVSLSGNGTSVQHKVSLTWVAPANSPLLVTGYNIYRATAGSSSFQLINSSSTIAYVDLQVLSGTAYNYYVTSTDNAGTESVPSNQVAVRVP